MLTHFLIATALLSIGMLINLELAALARRTRTPLYNAPRQAVRIRKSYGVIKIYQVWSPGRSNSNGQVPSNSGASPGNDSEFTQFLDSSITELLETTVN